MEATICEFANRDFNILYKIDSNFKVTLYKPEMKIYKICYDESENCYWALMEFDNKIYKLNENLTETIINITQLEYLLTNRLKSLQKFKWYNLKNVIKNLWYLYKFLTLNLQIQVIINQNMGKL